MSSEDLEVVAYAKVADGDGPVYSDGEIIEASTFEFTDRELGDKWRQVELVRREDAEAEIAEERSKKYDKGFFEGRQSREEEILDKIQQMMSDHDSDSSRVKTEFNKGYQAALRKIREKLRARKND